MSCMAKCLYPKKKMSEYTYEELKTLIKKAILYVKSFREDHHIFKFYVFDVECPGWIPYAKICKELGIEFWNGGYMVQNHQKGVDTGIIAVFYE